MSSVVLKWYNTYLKTEMQLYHLNLPSFRYFKGTFRCEGLFQWHIFSFCSVPEAPYNLLSCSLTLTGIRRPPPRNVCSFNHFDRSDHILYGVGSPLFQYFIVPTSRLSMIAQRPCDFPDHSYPVQRRYEILNVQRKFDSLTIADKYLPFRRNLLGMCETYCYFTYF